MNTFGERLKQFRISAGLTQEDLAKKCGITKQNISRYENSKREPNIRTAKAIADALGVMLVDLVPVEGILDVQKDNEDIEMLDDKVLKGDPAISALAGKYSALDEHGRAVVDRVLDLEYARCMEFEEEAPAPRTKIIPLFPAAAGPGEPVDGTAFQEHEVAADSPANFAVRISGDSMEPELHDGDIALCVRRRAQIGEIAVIMVNGFLYVKQYIEDSFGNIYLRSLNRKRKDLDVDILSSGSDTVTGYGVVIHRKVKLVQQ